MANWRHCPGIQNPADIGSRRVKSTELKEKDIWWNGPEWISDRNKWPKSEEVEETEESVEEQKKKCYSLSLSHYSGRERTTKFVNSC